jgi:hypothetical protein
VCRAGKTKRKKLLDKREIEILKLVLNKLEKLWIEFGRFRIRVIGGLLFPGYYIIIFIKRKKLSRHVTMIF